MAGCNRSQSVSPMDPCSQCMDANPVGMTFNPETARNEMINFWAVLFNQVAVDKFLHAISSGFLLASMFVLGISSWFLIRKREELIARRSILIAAIFGLLSSLMVAYTGDASARTISKVQPVKFASMEALSEGKSNAGLVAIGILKDSDQKIGDRVLKDFAFKIEIPGLLSVLTGGTNDAYVQGIKDHVLGNQKRGMMSVPEKMERGKFARSVLMDYKKVRIINDKVQLDSIS